MRVKETEDLLRPVNPVVLAVSPLEHASIEGWRVLQKQLVVAHIVKEFPAFREARRCITEFRRSFTRSVQMSSPSAPTSAKCVLRLLVTKIYAGYRKEYMRITVLQMSKWFYCERFVTSWNIVLSCLSFYPILALCVMFCWVSLLSSGSQCTVILRRVRKIARSDD